MPEYNAPALALGSVESVPSLARGGLWNTLPRRVNFSFAEKNHERHERAKRNFVFFVSFVVYFARIFPSQELLSMNLFASLDG